MINLSVKGDFYRKFIVFLTRALRQLKIEIVVIGGYVLNGHFKFLGRVSLQCALK